MAPILTFILAWLGCSAAWFALVTVDGWIHNGAGPVESLRSMDRNELALMAAMLLIMGGILGFFILGVGA